jgi:hypothetical protein
LELHEFGSENSEAVSPYLSIRFCDVKVREVTYRGSEHRGGPSSVPYVSCCFIIVPDVLGDVPEEGWYPSLGMGVFVHCYILDESVNGWAICPAKMQKFRVGACRE